jgi:hypothetical protein
MGNGMKEITFSNIYAVGQPSIAAAGHSLLAVSATIPKPNKDYPLPPPGGRKKPLNPYFV